MNVLYICADWGIPVRGFKGASVHVREFVNTLTRLGHQVLLLCATHGEGNPDPHVMTVEIEPQPNPERRGREAARLGLAFDPADAAVCRELDKLSYDSEFAARALGHVREREFRPDVVYERYSLFHGSGARIARTLEVPFVLEVNAPLIEEQERHRVLRLKTLAQRMQAACFRDADHLITVSEPLKEYLLAEGIGADRVSCLANGVDTRRFHPHADPEPIRARHSLGMQPVIGFVGSLKPWHGVDCLLDAMVLLRKRQLDCRLLIVGEGPGLQQTRERVRNDALEQHVLLAGKVRHEEIPAYLAAMDLTVAPYTAEQGFYFSPLKVLESLAAGRPVVAPRLGQLTELITHGVTGLLYEAGDVDGLADSVQALLSDPRRRAAMGANARRHAVTSLSWDNVVARAVEIMAHRPTRHDDGGRQQGHHMSHKHAPSGQSSERATVPLARAGERANGPDRTLDLPPALGVAAARPLDDPAYAAAVAASAGLKRILVYSHDTFGFGSVRRTLDISRHLVTVVPNLSVLIISGSPLLHASRTPSRVDYVKLPCLARTSEGAYEVKSLGVGYEELIHLRTTLTTSAILDFSPDLILVDKKPLGVSNELSQALQLLNTRGARTKVVLLLKDILDDPVTTAAIWQRHRYHEVIRSFYDRILVLGSSDIFDLVSEYRFPPLSRAKVHFCGYLGGDRGSRTRDQMRGMLGVHDERLVLVAGGSGETGYQLMANYVDGFNRLPNDTKIKSLLICGPEMSEPDRRRIRDAAVHPQLLTQEFDDDMMSCIDAADVVVSLAGYNTVCDILSLHKRAIVVPRVKPAREQLIRAERLARLGLLRALHPDRLTPTRLMHAVMEELWAHDDRPREACKVDLDGMSRVASSLQALLHDGARLSPALMT